MSVNFIISNKYIYQIARDMEDDAFGFGSSDHHDDEDVHIENDDGNLPAFARSQL